MEQLSNVGIILVDMQEGFTRNIRDLDTLIESQVKVIWWCAKLDFPLAVLEKEPETYQQTIPYLNGSISEIPRHKKFRKKKMNGFHNRGLEKILRAWKVREVFLMGVYASQCVYSTAKGAKSRGFGVHTSGDVIKDRTTFYAADIPRIYREIGNYYRDYNEFLSRIVSGED